VLAAYICLLLSYLSELTPNGYFIMLKLFFKQ
jgi:hypothetical protein